MTITVGIVSFYGPVLGTTPPSHGGVQRARLLARYLESAGFRLRVLSFCAPGTLATDGRERCVPMPFRAAPEWVRRRYADARDKPFAAREWMHVAGLADARRLAQLAQDWLADVDIVIHKYPWNLPAMRRAYQSLGVPVILGLHNAESDRLRQASRLPELALARLEALEVRAILQSDAYVCVTHADAQALTAVSGIKPAFVSQNPVRQLNADPTSARRAPRSRDVLFVGSNLRPNADAARYIVEQLAPAMPHVTFTLLGGCSTALRPTPPNVTLGGVVSDAAIDHAYDTHRVVAVPLRSGSGSSLKAVEALARGAHLVSTPVGVRGLRGAETVADIVPIDGFAPALNAALRTTANPHLAARRVAWAEQFRPERVFERYPQLIETLRARG